MTEYLQQAAVELFELRSTYLCSSSFLQFLSSLAWPGVAQPCVVGSLRELLFEQQLRPFLKPSASVQSSQAPGFTYILNLQGSFIGVGSLPKNGSVFSELKHEHHSFMA